MARSTFDDFKVMEKVGSGNYGVVYKVVRKVDRMVYAMKEIELEGMSRKEQEECIKETRVLSSLDSQYIIKYYDSFLEKGKLYIITEYAANGNLHDYITRQRQRLPEDLVWKLFLQVLLGLNHMHSCKILHRDVKTLNVFLDEGLNVKLGDMGVARILSSSTTFAKTLVGTPYYLSPELCEDKPYNEKSDVWALGVVLYECCSQKHPFDADNQGALILKILRGRYPPLVGYSPDISDLVKRCLTQNAMRRPDTLQLLAMPKVRRKAEELGVMLGCQQVLVPAAAAPLPKKPMPPTRPRTPKTDESAPPPRQLIKARAEAAQLVRQLPKRAPYGGPGLGLIRMIGNMDAPLPQPAAAPSREAPSMQAPSSPNSGRSSISSSRVNSDKAFVFGALVDRPLVQPEAMASCGDHAHAAGTSGEGDEDEDGSWPVQAGWRVAGADDGTAAAAQQMGGMHLCDDNSESSGSDDDDDDGASCQPRHDDNDATKHYNQPYSSGAEDYQSHEDGSETEEQQDSEVELQRGASDIAHHGHASSRAAHMRRVLAVQKAACLGMVGQTAFDQLYNLLRSNQMDEPGSTDLSRLVFDIIPYDKSQAVQMMYKLLYLEAQLEGFGA